jgi:hypothetical protein
MAPLLKMALSKTYCPIVHQCIDVPRRLKNSKLISHKTPVQSADKLKLAKAKKKKHIKKIKSINK